MDFTPKAPGVGLLQCGFDASQGGVVHFYEDDGITIGNTWSRFTTTTSLPLTPQTKHAAVNDINGLYMVDENNDSNANPNPLAGLLVVSDRKGKYLRDELCMVGTDDGIHWWARTGGTFTDKMGGAFAFPAATSDPNTTSTTQLTGTIHNGTMTLLSGDDQNTTTWTKRIPEKDLHALPKQSANL